jgi:hypothetical protein
MTPCAVVGKPYFGDGEENPKSEKINGAWTHPSDFSGLVLKDFCLCGT